MGSAAGICGAKGGSMAALCRSFVRYLQENGWQICAVYCMDAQFVTDATKFIAGSLAALSAMAQLEVPHVNLITKVDLCADKVGGATRAAAV